MGWSCLPCGGSNPDGTRFCGHCGAPFDGQAAQPVDEQRLITALFADISGFTSLADRLDAEQLHEVIAPVISILAGVAEDHGGTLAKYAGDAVLVFFGAPVAQEDHAGRALRCAEEMHQELAAALDRLPDDARGLELHIGVNSGRVVAGMFGGDIRTDYSILGDAVNVAQRLESVAPPGQTYVGESTQQLTSDEFELESLGTLELKGKSEPVAAWRLVGRRQATATPPVRTGPLVGRERELEYLRRILDDLEAGGGLVLLTADAGTGKSRLTEAVRDAARERNLVWLEARGISYGASLPYWPLIDLLRRSFGIRIEQDPHLSSQALAAALAIEGVPEVAPYFARVLGLSPPDGFDDVAVMEPEAFRRALHAAVVTWLRHLAATRPVVLVVEDLHWADTSTTDLLVSLAPAVDEGRLLLYLTGRPEAHAAMERIGSAVARTAKRQLTLSPLGEKETARLLHGILGAPPGRTLLSTVLERTGGNPFFAQELARALQATGELRVVDGTWEISDDWDAAAVPPTIEGVLAARMDLLPRGTSSVLQMASVIGRNVSLPLLEGTAEDVADLPRVVDQLVDSGFLDRRPVDGVETLMFHHSLMVDVAYSRLVRRQRRDVHRRVAETAEVLYGTGDDVIDLLARHYYLAEAGVKAVDYLEKASERSARLFANEEAILHIERAVDLTRATERLTSRLPGLVLRLGDLKELTGRYDEALVLYDEVRTLSNDVRAWRGLASVQRKHGDYAGARQVVDDAFAEPALLEEDLTALWLERTWSHVTEGRFLDAIETAQAGLAATARPDSREAGHLLLQLARAETALQRCDDALVHGEQARRILEADGDTRGLTTALRIVGNIHADAGDLDQAVHFSRLALELAQRTGNAEEVAGCLLNIGMNELDRGNLDAAIACDYEALVQMERMGHTSGLTMVEANLAEKLAMKGELDEALARCIRALELATASADAWTIADCHRTLANIHHKEGLHAESATRAEEAAALFLELGDKANARDALELAAGVLDAAGENERARLVSERARSL